MGNFSKTETINQFLAWSTSVKEGEREFRGTFFHSSVYLCPTHQEGTNLNTLSCRGTLIFFHSWLPALNLRIENTSQERERRETWAFSLWKALGRRDLFDLITGEQRRGDKKKRNSFESQSPFVTKLRAVVCIRTRADGCPTVSYVIS